MLGLVVGEVHRSECESQNLMKHAQPRGLNRRHIQQLLSKSECSADRIDFFSRHFLGSPYLPDSLVGSADTDEVFTISFDGFDCVTYIETVLALAGALEVDDFVERLRKIRYEDGRVEWTGRNHYSTGWIRNNLREGIVRPLWVPAIPIRSTERILNVVPGLAARRVRIKCIAKRSVPRLTANLQSGDLIFFVSTRQNLDVFHAGIIARDGRRVFMRHASRSKAAVVEQELSEFLKSNRMSGIIVIRPQRINRHGCATLTKRSAPPRISSSRRWDAANLKS